MACNRWRIAVSFVGLPRGLFLPNRLPMPETFNLTPFSELIPSSEGATNESGYVKCVITWTNMPRGQLFFFRNLTDNMANHTRLYMTVDRNNGTRGVEEWVDISGYPTLSYPTAEAVGRRDKQAYNVTLSLNNVIIIGSAY